MHEWVDTATVLAFCVFLAHFVYFGFVAVISGQFPITTGTIRTIRAAVRSAVVVVRSFAFLFARARRRSTRSTRSTGRHRKHAELHFRTFEGRARRLLTERPQGDRVARSHGDSCTYVLAEFEQGVGWNCSLPLLSEG